MAYVITDKCAATCDTACVDACPCDCISGPVPVAQLRQVPATERAERFSAIQMFVDPERCINCGACFMKCPSSAIYLDDNVPAEHIADIARNAAFFALGARRNALGRPATPAPGSCAIVAAL